MNQLINVGDEGEIKAAASGFEKTKQKKKLEKKQKPHELFNLTINQEWGEINKCVKKA